MIALVLGSAECLHADIERARKLVDVDTCMVVACNQAVAEWPGRLDHFATMHPEEMAPWLERRRGRGYPDGYETWTRPYPHGFKDRERMCDHVIGGWADGSSGMLALGVAIENGGTRNLLCGIPMDTRDHFNAGAWNAAASYRDKWEAEAGELREATRSFSGWTAGLLGRPTPEWIAKPCRLDTPQASG